MIATERRIALKAAKLVFYCDHWWVYDAESCWTQNKFL